MRSSCPPESRTPRSRQCWRPPNRLFVQSEQYDHSLSHGTNSRPLLRFRVRRDSSPPTFARDLLASVVVFLVALPLCMGIAIASGVPPAMGLLSGIVGGLVVGVLAGSPLQVSGPAAGLAVIVFEIVQSHGLPALAVVITAAGLLQIAAGFLRIGQWFRAVAPAVIYAMLAGIGVLIFASQFHVMVDDTPAASGLTNLATIPSAIIKGLVPLDGSSHHLAAGLGVLTLTVLITWNALRKWLPRWLAILPAPLLAVGAATAAAAATDLPVAYVAVPAGLGALISLPSPSDLLLLANPAILGSAFAVAAVASAESLLSAAAVDKLHDGARTDFDRELAAQGIGNVILGVLGGLPVTGVIVRSSANVEAGAKTRASAILHGMWLLLALAAFPWVLETIPVASLAAVLVYIGYKLVKIDSIRALWARGRGEVAIYALTVVAIIVTSLLEGLLVGLALSVLRLAYMSSHLRITINPADDGSVIVDLEGAATFVVLPRLARALESLPPKAVIHLHIDRLSYIDHACFDLIRDWERQREARKGGEVILKRGELERRNRGDRGQPTTADIRQGRANPQAHQNRANLKNRENIANC
ncbi:MAG TPA: SulP family inorganic anion transporter [Nannocystis exedens]|nr:SulP family inorganic anion transporter [Nannocystis exedens]